MKPLTQQDRRAAWDRGIADAAAHHVHGARLANPFADGTRRAFYWRRAADAASSALLKVLDLRP